MAEKGPFTQALALRMQRACKGIDFIGNDGKPYEPDWEADAQWFVAYQMAEQMHSDHTVKDWAHYVLNGMEPLTDEDVKEWFWPEDGDVTGLPSEEELRKWRHG